jgi:hypothetical protein
MQFLPRCSLSPLALSDLELVVKLRILESFCGTP